jgi:hypothetical protein
VFKRTLEDGRPRRVEDKPALPDIDPRIGIDSES